MKFKPTILLATFVITIGLLLGASAAQAAEVIFDPGDPNKAIGITNLDIGETSYDVAFDEQTPAVGVYGDLPGEFDFSTSDLAQAAIEAVNAALNAENARRVGEEGSLLNDFQFLFFIGYSSTGVGTLAVVNVWQASIDEGTWANIGADPLLYNGDERTYATFTLAGPAPDPVTIGGSVSGLVEGGVLVLQNNASDDRTITADGEFTFDTPLTPGTSYSVTVFTQPEGQICSVENGSGQVPAEAVTDVAVSCAEAPVGDVVKVAAEGETLPDGTLLKQIILDGGVAINLSGKVAFGGRDGDNTIAVFTQDGLVVAERGTLPDGTILDDISPIGEVATSAGQTGDRVAFHGRTGGNKAVFTQAGLVAAEGGTLPDGTLVDEIRDGGKVAINDSDQVAFHGGIEVEDNLFNERFLAVFTTDGLVAQEDDTLPDGTTLSAIDYIGGVAINDFGEVAFHGDVLESGDFIEAVFTQDGLVARKGGTLPDGTIVSDIDENGGVAINLFGDVAFHGDFVLDPGAGADTRRAVFTQNGLVAKEGDTLPDGTLLDEITESGGVAINYFGDVAFHGRTGGFQAVFTQYGLIAKKGDPLADSTILSEIHQSGGVAINYFGKVSFHGKVGVDTDVVLVGQAPVAEGE